jgi:hypothetical protein
MLSLAGSTNTAWVHVLIEHILITLHNGFAKIMYRAFGFFIANPGCVCVSITFDCSFPEAFSLMSARKGVFQCLAAVCFLLCE